jgi:transcriptional regulator with XRE-family HTH domain
LTFGEKLKALREIKNLKQDELSKLLNIDRSTIGKWENDTSRPDFMKLLKISEYFGVSTDYLLGKIDRLNESPEIKEKCEIFEKISNLSPKSKKYINEYIDFLKYKEDKEKYQKTDVSKKNEN